MYSSAFARDLASSASLSDDLPTNSYLPSLLFGRAIVTLYQNCLDGLPSPAPAINTAASKAIGIISIRNRLKYLMFVLSFLVEIYSAPSGTTVQIRQSRVYNHKVGRQGQTHYRSL